jgi:AcrR family transcriptional regulator
MSVELACVDPRVTRTRARVSDAVAAIFEEDGAAELTHQRVAMRAGVGRATVYRHWPRSVDLLAEALSRSPQPLLHEGRGPFRAWISREIRRAATQLGQPAATQFVAAVVAAGSGDSEIVGLRDDLNGRTARVMQSMVARAVAKGELNGSLRVDDLVAALLGPLIYRVAIQGLAADDTFLIALVDGALRGCEHPSR